MTYRPWTDYPTCVITGMQSPEPTGPPHTTHYLLCVQFGAAYSTGKALVPLPHSVINALENTMSDLGGNLISTAAQQSEKVRVWQASAVYCCIPLHVYSALQRWPTS